MEKNMEEKIMNKVYRTNREMYKTIRPFVKKMGWERFVIEFKEAVQDYHNDNCGGKFAYIFAIKGEGEVQLVLERDNALWLESLLNSKQTFNDDDMRDKVGDYDFYAIYDKEMANVTTFFEDTRDGDYVKFGNMGWDVEMDVAWFKKIDGLWITCNKAECKKLEKNAKNRELNKTNDNVANKIANQISDAKNNKEIKFGNYTPTKSERLFYVQLHNRFAELEKVQNPIGNINNEAQYQQHLQQDNPVFMGILVTVLNNRCWLNHKNKDLCKTYGDLFRDLHYGVMGAWDEHKIADEYFQTYYSIVD